MTSQFHRWFNLREAYRAIFQRNKPTRTTIETLLADLREFCRADTTCIVVAKDGHIDTHATAVAEGRREVFLRIQATLNISDDDLARMRSLEND